eukprot:8767512-Alexandrium_andersonii.AAC.1
MSRGALGLDTRMSREDAAAQLTRTSPSSTSQDRQARSRVRLPWGRRHTVYNPDSSQESDEENDYEVDESPGEAAAWLRE